jgi:ribose 5-phosphate isomerase A
VNEADREAEKGIAGEAAALLVQDGWNVGLGTGSTVAHLLPALAERKLDVRCVATSPATEDRARALGLHMVPFDRLERLDIAIDGADLVDPRGWLIKGRGGAHTREKIVAAAADRFVVIVSSDKLVDGLSPPVPLELLPFGIAATVRLLEPVALRDAPPSPDGGVIADYMGAMDDPARVAEWLSAVPGVVEHGLFAPELTTEVLIGRGSEVERRVIP